MELRFTKMNGAGNDFVVIDNRSGEFPLDKPAIARLCDRHRGIGADGLLAVETAAGPADFRMRYYNADGGEAEMCGNGARCFARFAARLMPSHPATVDFETMAGKISAALEGDLVSLDMGKPHGHRPAQTLEAAGQKLSVHFINTGVPHAVVFFADIEPLDIPSLGSAIRHHAAFAPKGTNANFVQVLGPGLLAIRTYERGVEGETLACGTGVCAAALIHAAENSAPSPVAVQVRGGDTLRVDFTRAADGSFESARLTGPADFVFEGVVSL
ncbi:MAG: diaminopimelate epimerase [Verrucomicrobia bacterium]|nr:diaminopimelate epimerase [Verrucomicrobiota bacterium]